MDNRFIATRWQLFKARLFGKRTVSRDGNCKVVAHFYKGTWFISKVMYFSDSKESDESAA